MNRYKFSKNVSRPISKAARHAKQLFKHDFELPVFPKGDRGFVVNWAQIQRKDRQSRRKLRFPCELRIDGKDCSL